MVGECCLEGRPKKKRDTRAVWKDRPNEEEKARNRVRKDRKEGTGGRREENVRRNSLEETIAFDQDTKKRIERSKIEQFFIDKPYEFCRKICPGEALEDVESQANLRSGKTRRRGAANLPIRGRPRERGARIGVSCCQNRRGKSGSCSGGRRESSKGSTKHSSQRRLEQHPNPRSLA